MGSVTARECVGTLVASQVDKAVFVDEDGSLPPKATLHENNCNGHEDHEKNIEKHSLEGRSEQWSRRSEVSCVLQFYQSKIVHDDDRHPYHIGLEEDTKREHEYLCAR